MGVDKSIFATEQVMIDANSSESVVVLQGRKPMGVSSLTSGIVLSSLLWFVLVIGLFKIL